MSAVLYAKNMWAQWSKTSLWSNFSAKKKNAFCVNGP